MAFATTLNTGTRIVSMLSDHFIMTIIVMIISAPWFIILIMADQHMVVVNDLLMSIYAAAAFSVYFNKDIYLGQSIGKRLLRFAHHAVQGIRIIAGKWQSAGEQKIEDYAGGPDVGTAIGGLA